MKKFLSFCSLLICLLAFNNDFVFGHDANEIKGIPNVFTHEELKDKGQQSQNFPKLSCVLIKSIAYGLQKAVDEFAQSQQDTNLSKAIRDINLSHYLSDYCPENKKENPEKPEKPKEEKTHEKSKKVKRNQHSINNRSKPINETRPSASIQPLSTENITGIKEGINHDKQEKLEMVKHQKANDFGRLLRSFEEVTNALKQQLLQEANDHRDQHQSQWPPSPPSSFPASPTSQHLKHEHEHQHAPNAVISTLDAPKPNKTGNNQQKDVLMSIITSGNNSNSNQSTNHSKTDTIANKIENKSRHSHNHHKKRRSKSKSKSKVELPVEAVDETNFADGDDHYVSERLKQDKLMSKDEEFTDAVPKHQVKRSAEKYSQKKKSYLKKNGNNAGNKSKFGKFDKFSKKKTQKKSKSNGKIYKKARN